VFFSQLINLNTRSLPAPGQHPVQCLLILDEFPALGKINVLARANAFIAGYNLRLLTIVQSIAQLESVYGHQDARTLITNHAMQVLFTPREQRDANAYSEALGYHTPKALSTGRSVSRGLGAGGSTSENLSDQRRALMLPQELKELPDDDQIIILENTKPIRCQKAKYFRERVLMDRLAGGMAQTKGRLSKLDLDRLAFQERRLAASVPHLDIAAHLASTARQDSVPPELGIDLSALDVDPDALPEISDPANPAPSEIEALVQTFFSLADIEPDEVVFDLEPEANSVQSEFVEV
jgi:type IV secretion system protein VirD4